jgi:hypothetical protein
MREVGTVEGNEWLCRYILAAEWGLDTARTRFAGEARSDRIAEIEALIASIPDRQLRGMEELRRRTEQVESETETL